MNKSNDIEQLTRTARIEADRLASQIGVSAAASQCGVSRLAFSNFLAALPSQRGTVLSVAHGLGMLVVPSALAIASLPHAS